MQLYNSRLDKISIGASIACAVHCVVLPIVLTSLTFWGVEWVENPWIEGMTLSLTFFVGGWAIYRGYKRYHQSRRILCLFIMGVFVLMVSNLTLISDWEIPLKSFGTFFVILAHLRNWKSCRACECPVCEYRQKENESIQ
jgi:hypothetical protein